MLHLDASREAPAKSIMHKLSRLGSDKPLRHRPPHAWQEGVVADVHSIQGARVLAHDFLAES
eukprot:7380808-Prymnesium_polylepis.1